MAQNQQSDPTRSAATPGGDFDQLPYASMPRRISPLWGRFTVCSRPRPPRPASWNLALRPEATSFPWAHMPEPMGHVILREFYLDRQVQYFADYGRQYTDMPMPVRLVERGDTLVPDRLPRASDFPDTWARPIIPSGRRSPLTRPPSASSCPRARSAFAGARKASGTLRRRRRVVGKPTCK